MVIGIALRGLGKALLKKGSRKKSKAGKFLERRVNLRDKKIDDAAAKFMKRREVLRGASKKASQDQTKKKFKRVVTDFSKASERADKFSKDLKKKSGG
jgi:hypothetical protein|tara:strand:+ start:338 stop:631 length:294 start_codon:yes stop_codon:yes gene_type:complete